MKERFFILIIAFGIADFLLEPIDAASETYPQAGGRRTNHRKFIGCARCVIAGFANICARGANPIPHIKIDASIAGAARALPYFSDKGVAGGEFERHGRCG
jgi:hypothetical protein